MAGKIKVGLIIFLILVAGFLLGGWLIMGRGFSAREEPTSLEVFLARRLRNLATPRAAKNATNPVALSSTVLSQAMAHFADHCAVCHANDGSGDTVIGKGLYPKPPDMRKSATQDLRDGELFYIIHNGVRLTGMPAFGDESGPDLGSWQLVHFIRHLPKITAEEVEQMKEMNPKAPDEWREEEAIKRFLEGHDGR